jgi:shikimate kinase
MKITLIGARCSGKTTVGRELAGRLDLRFIDTDALVEERTGKKVAEIFAEDGEAAFRELEREAIAELETAEGCVIAAGGGALCDAKSAAALKRGAKVLWLDTSTEELVRRAEADGEERPPLTGLTLREETEKIVAERRGLYMNSADCIIDTDGFTPGEITERITSYLQLLGLIKPE